MLRGENAGLSSKCPGVKCRGVSSDSGLRLWVLRKRGELYFLLQAQTGLHVRLPHLSVRNRICKRLRSTAAFGMYSQRFVSFLVGVEEVVHDAAGVWQDCLTVATVDGRNPASPDTHLNTYQHPFQVSSGYHILWR